MKRRELEHIIRATAAITGHGDWVVIGSQAILAQFPQAPVELLVSTEADIFAPGNPAHAELVEGSIGEGAGIIP